MIDPNSESPTVLIVDDEPAVAEVVSLYLKKEGYQVKTAHDGRMALAKLEEPVPTLVVLDIMLPEIDGLTVLAEIRERCPETAVIMLTAKRQEVDKIYGLELGADDYMVKPFSPAELVARVKAILRRVQSTTKELVNSSDQLNFGEGALVIDARSHQVTVNGDSLELTATEFNLLQFMARHPNQVFSRDQLLEKVWGMTEYVDPNTVTVHIRRVREKIEPDPSKPSWLQTVWGVGYKFMPA
ncbi:MAG: response regulator transcription factor [Chloroflexota bacterium]